MSRLAESEVSVLASESGDVFAIDVVESEVFAEIVRGIGVIVDQFVFGVFEEGN